MAKQVINLGSSYDDPTADPIRDGLDKCNDNFTELYAMPNTETQWNAKQTFVKPALYESAQAINGDSINVIDYTYLELTPETGPTQNDSIETIIGGDAGQIIVLRGCDGLTGTITINENDNIRVKGGTTLAISDEYTPYMFIKIGDYWCQL